MHRSNAALKVEVYRVVGRSSAGAWFEVSRWFPQQDKTLAFVLFRIVLSYFAIILSSFIIKLVSQVKHMWPVGLATKAGRSSSFRTQLPIQRTLHSKMPQLHHFLYNQVALLPDDSC